ncbi:hypothetical protein PRUPE_7G077900 [Prunus persica]|uniref:Secreted protein n=1 Tax=Prunus persica TaxID=3760 RepID=A0A251N8B6_PRUPE|nr:hypothetical protein PRUPE_7G077900 [Prunus persica]
MKMFLKFLKLSYGNWCLVMLLAHSQYSYLQATCSKISVRTCAQLPTKRVHLLHLHQLTLFTRAPLNSLFEYDACWTCSWACPIVLAASTLTLM